MTRSADAMLTDAKRTAASRLIRWSRARGEYGEMPGLRLTVSQACRLWQVDRLTCETVLERLVRKGLLYKTDRAHTRRNRLSVRKTGPVHGELQRYLHGYSALSRASSRHSSDKGQ